MKVLGINGSPRREGNTSILLHTVFEALAAQGIETELYQAGGRPVQGCRACGWCREHKEGKCVMDDWVNDLLHKMLEADAILLGSPVYFGDITPEIKAVMDRTGYVSRANGNLLSRKVGAAVVALRRSGGMHAFDSLNHFFLINEMLVPGSSYWNIAYGREAGEVKNDAEGMATLKRLGEQIGWLLGKTRG